MEFRVLGPLEVIGSGEPIKIGGRLRRAILALLVLHVGETVTTNRLIEDIWGEDPPHGAHALEVHVSGLRQALGANSIEAQPGGYRLRADGNDVDLGRFEALVAEASRNFDRGDPLTAAAGYAAGLALWRGPALADLATADILPGERARLDELRALALERWIDAELGAGHHLDVVPELRSIVDQMPLREAFRARLMLALYRSGRQSEALEVYHQARAVLDRELGVDPGPELEALQRAVLVHDPGLAIALSPRSANAGVRPSDPGLDGRQAPLPSGVPAQFSEPVSGPAAARRNVTTLIADFAGASLTGERLDPESEQLPLDRCYRALRAAAQRHGGMVEHLAGDALMAVFGVPKTHEDDALRAVRAASEMRHTLAALNTGFQRELGVRVTMRVGVNTGAIVTGDVAAASLVRGEAVTAASILEQAAGPGEILIGSATHHLVRAAVEVEPAGEIDTRGRSGPISAMRLLSVRAGVRGHAGRFDTPLVGRDRELRQLEAALRKASADETSQLFSVLGPAGVGKSRLIHEFLRSVRPRAQVLRGRCTPYDERLALWPVAETVRQAAEISETDEGEVVRAKIAGLLVGNPRASAIAERVAALVGASEIPSTSEETSWAIRSAFEAVARRRPLVIVFDDVQWGEPAFLDLVDFIADTSRGAPILLVCLARPELLEVRPGWGGGKFNATSVFLEPLADAEVSRLVANLLGGSRPAAAIERKIVEAAEGNPLFVEEFLAMLIGDGAIQRAGDEWIATADLSSIATPASIAALLAARLDRLPADERDVLGRASVVGKSFTREAVEELVAGDSLPHLGRRLESLVRLEIIRPDRSASEGVDSYRFKHILIRDAAYASLPKSERIVLHERLAHWLARTSHGDGNVADEVIGAHLEQAYRYRIELGPIDDRALEVGRAAAMRLAAVGRRAHVRGEASGAEGLLSRAAALLPADDRERLLLLDDLAQSLIDRGEFAVARRTNDELLARAESAGFEDVRWAGRLNRIWLDVQTTGNVSPEITEDVRAAINFFEALGHHQGAGRAWNLTAFLAMGGGRMAESRFAQEHALQHARRVGDIRGESRALYEMAWVDIMIPETVADATRTATELLERARAAGTLSTEAMALSQLGRLKAMQGAFDEARQLVASAIDIVHEMGRRPTDASTWVGMIEWLANDPVAAEQALRRGYEELESVGESRARGHIAAELARVLYLQGRFGEAYEYAQDVEAWAWGSGSPPASICAGVQGMILARRGEVSAAIAVAREAVAIAEGTGLGMFHARALEDLAEVFELSGRPEEARPLLVEALRLYDQKGITVLAERARQRLAV